MRYSPSSHSANRSSHYFASKRSGNMGRLPAVFFSLPQPGKKPRKRRGSQQYRDNFLTFSSQTSRYNLFYDRNIVHIQRQRLAVKLSVLIRTRRLPGKIVTRLGNVHHGSTRDSKARPPNTAFASAVETICRKLLRFARRIVYERQRLDFDQSPSLIASVPDGSRENKALLLIVLAEKP